MFKEHTTIYRSITKLFLWPLCIAFMIFINGCSTVSHRDGPPSYNVDVSKIPDAIPKVEPLAKYGNMPTYRVFGKKYHVMKSAKHYEQRGVASWYGMKFHRQRTSSGEPYNLLAMTAAHKTLPLPTYVQVTNLKNGKKVVVKVNDRGPFSGDRIIDLSYVAAKKLGMLGHGTTYVNVKAIDPNEIRNHPDQYLFANNTKAVKQPHPPVYLQIGSFKNKVYAERLKKRLLPMVSLPIQIAHAQKQLYRVKIGPIKDVATATQITKKLHTMGLSAKHIET